MSANVETMFYVREKPWHGLGTMVQEAPTSADALRLAGLDWTVEARDMWLNGGYEPIPGYKANVRSSDNKVLGVVSDKYRIVQNADAFAFTDGRNGLRICGDDRPRRCPSFSCRMAGTALPSRWCGGLQGQALPGF